MSFTIQSLSTVQTALGAAVLSSLWQGAAIGLVAAGALRCMERRSAAARHGVAFGALLACLAAFGSSFALALQGPAPTAATSVLRDGLASAPATPGYASSVLVERFAALAWLIGFTFMAVRFALQCAGVRRLRRQHVSDPGEAWRAIFDELKLELGVDRGVRLLRSGLAEVPMVVGWLSPVVLVPASAFLGLSADQLRALLAHELAHVRRNDHWLNAAQAVVETVLFFHPVVWWLSREVRLEREFCCDDSSVHVTGDPRLLAEALASMEALRPDPTLTRTVLAANGGPLMQRITRILGARQAGHTSLVSWQLPASLALASMVALGGVATPSVSTHVTSVDDKPLHVESQRRTDEVKERKRRLYMEILQLREELAQAVKAGKLTEAQAKEHLAVWKKSHERKSAQTHEAHRVWEKLEAAVKAGKITEAQAKERFAGWEKSLKEKHLAREEKLVRADIEAAVAAGRLTRAEAKEHLHAWRQRSVKAVTVEGRPMSEAMVKEILTAVEKGELTPAQGKAKIEAMRQRIAEEKAVRKHIEKVRDEIQVALKAGQLTREEAHQKIRQLERELDEKHGARRKKMPDAEIVRRKIHSAIQSGELTAAEGAARLRAYEEKLKARQAALLESDLRKQEEGRRASQQAKRKPRIVEGHELDR